MTMPEQHEELFVSHPTEGRVYTRSPDAKVPSHVRVGDILPIIGHGSKPSEKEHSAKEPES